VPGQSDEHSCLKIVESTAQIRRCRGQFLNAARRHRLFQCVIFHARDYPEKQRCCESCNCSQYHVHQVPPVCEQDQCRHSRQTSTDAQRPMISNEAASTNNDPKRSPNLQCIQIRERAPTIKTTKAVPHPPKRTLMTKKGKLYKTGTAGGASRTRDANRLSGLQSRIISSIPQGH
jgi:hypothetical protein